MPIKMAEEFLVSLFLSFRTLFFLQVLDREDFVDAFSFDLHKVTRPVYLASYFRRLSFHRLSTNPQIPSTLLHLLEGSLVNQCNISVNRTFTIFVTFLLHNFKSNTRKEEQLRNDMMKVIR